MPESLLDFTISVCQPEDFKTVVNYIARLELDNNDLQYAQFVVAKHKEEVVGFGRLRTYSDCQELCSLGVIEPHRFKGLGTQLSKELIQKSTKPLYLVAIIPSFFERLGFSIVKEYPKEIATKMAYCVTSLPVDETYVAMQLK